MGKVKVLGCELWESEKVKRLLEKRGFYFGIDSIVGETVTEVTEISIFVIDPTLKPKKTFFFREIIEPLKMWIGVIWFENQEREAYLDSWVFDIYGEENMTLAKELASEFASEFSIDVTVRLIDKRKYYEDNSSLYDTCW